MPFATFGPFLHASFVLDAFLKSARLPTRQAQNHLQIREVIGRKFGRISEYA